MGIRFSGYPALLLGLVCVLQDKIKLVQYYSREKEASRLRNIAEKGCQVVKEMTDRLAELTAGTGITFEVSCKHSH